MQKLPKLPIGIQHFHVLREGNYVYIDKTEWVHRLADDGGAFFLSRPRRFGKSLFVHTLAELANGRRDLFQGLWIEDKWDWSRRYPVLHFEFSAIPFQGIGLDAAIRRELYKICQNYDIIPDIDDIKALFQQILQEIYAKHGKVFLLIDEYDKPIIHYLEDDKIEIAEENQRIMKDLYGVLKSCGHLIHLTLITGVSKFTRVSIFSDLNHLEDLTFDERFATAYGYTQEELEVNFEYHIQAFLKKNNTFSKEKLLEEIKEWYNGYSWDGQTSVYNPYGIIHFFQKKQFKSTWFESGTPTFLVRRFLHGKNFKVEHLNINLSQLDFHNVDALENIPLMFQAGYLTIKELDVYDNAVLDYPNREVREGFYRFLLKDLNLNNENELAPITILAAAFRSNDLEKIEDIIKQVFLELPYDVYTNQKPRQVEGFYHGIIHILFHYIGLMVQSEVHTNRGRADAVVTTDTHIYLFEFKINESSGTALAQIRTKDYGKKYQNSNKTLVLIGANFDTVEREMEDWEISDL